MSPAVIICSCRHHLFAFLVSVRIGDNASRRHASSAALSSRYRVFCARWAVGGARANCAGNCVASIIAHNGVVTRASLTRIVGQPTLARLKRALCTKIISIFGELQQNEGFGFNFHSRSCFVCGNGPDYLVYASHPLA